MLDLKQDLKKNNMSSPKFKFNGKDAKLAVPLAIVTVIAGFLVENTDLIKSLLWENWASEFTIWMVAMFIAYLGKVFIQDNTK